MSSFSLLMLLVGLAIFAGLFCVFVIAPVGRSIEIPEAKVLKLCYFDSRAATADSSPGIYTGGSASQFPGLAGMAQSSNARETCGVDRTTLLILRP
jgi:hypothetical protein